MECGDRSLRIDRDARMSPFLALTGPTAVGKTELALELAERIGAEIVSVDSRQIYRALDIGTAKPTPEQQDRVPHHFIDERELSNPINAGGFAAEAEQRIDEILLRGRVPLAVGGSTLYLAGLVHGLAELPPVPKTLTAALTAATRTPEGRRALFDELASADPRAAETLDPSKTHRLVRLVGVLRMTGTPPSEAWESPAAPRHRFQVIVLDRSRDELYRRIEQRVDAMLDAGLLEENRQLLSAGVDLSSSPMRTIGYQEPQAYLRGEIGLKEMEALLKRNSRRYAKRQLTWFRRYKDYLWIDAESASVETVLEAINSSSPAR